MFTFPIGYLANNDNGKSYGKLYNWYAIDHGSSLAPSGWHVPTSAEFNTLATYLSTNVGGKLKETGLLHWNTPNLNANNEALFYGLGSGQRFNTGSFASFKNNCYLYTATLGGEYPYYRYMYFNNGNFVQSSTGNKNVGRAVRMIKNDSTDPGSLTDYDGNIYETIKIGTQVWINQNWKSESYDDGTSIPEITDNTAWGEDTTGAWCYYNNNPNYN